MKTEINKPARQSNIELLRILAMVLIVAHHFAVHSGLPLWDNNSFRYSLLDIDHLLSLKAIYVQMMSTGGKLGVDLFVIITGYFLINSTTKVSSIIRVWWPTFFYSVGIYLLFVFSGGGRIIRSRN